MKTDPVKVEVLVKGRYLVGECPIWRAAENALYWVDIFGHAIHRLDLSSGRASEWPMPEDIGCFGLYANGDMLVALRSGIHRYDPSSRQLSLLAAADYDTATRRFNDGRCDARGRFWVGTMYEPRNASLGSLYCFDPAKGLSIKLPDSVIVANGMAFSPDERSFYISDSTAHKVWVHDFDPDTGNLSNRRLIIEATEAMGRPDGAAIDSDGGYWSAMIGKVVRFAPDGRLDRVIEVPARRVTMCAFGGAAMNQMFITTACSGYTDEDFKRDPLAGSIFVCRPGVTGIPEPVVAEIQ